MNTPQRAFFLLTLIMACIVLHGENIPAQTQNTTNRILAYAITPPDGNAEIFVINADGSGKRQLTDQPGRLYGPAYSPKATKIAFYNHMSNSLWSLYLMDADGGNIQRLTNASDALDWSPDWSPDGSRIAFARSFSSPTWRSEIWAINPDGSNAHRLGSAEGQGPDWSPDGTKIAYFDYVEGGGDIWVMDADGSSSIKLTENPSEDWWPKFSPDGSQIAFQSRRDGNFEIYAMNSDGSHPVRLTDNSADDEDPNWSPDGKMIAFISMRDGHYELYKMNADGSNQTRITATNGQAIDPDWRPSTKLASIRRATIAQQDDSSVGEGSDLGQGPPGVTPEVVAQSGVSSERRAHAARDILRATQKGEMRRVKAILAANPHLAKVKDQWGRTPLHLAVDTNDVEMMEYFIECGAEVEATDVYGWTPLFRAIDGGNKQAVEFLIAWGADVNHGIEDGFKPVHLATSVGNAELLELLLQKGAGQDEKERHGLTPLHIAAAYGFHGAAELLLSYQTDMNAKSTDGGTPVHFARAGGHQEIADLIRAKGANGEPRRYPDFVGKYLGFKGPGLKPEIFLPGIIMHLNPPHNGLTMSPDAKEIYWAETSINYELYSRIWFMKEVDGFWTPPRIAPFSCRYLDGYPCFSVDGKRLFFSSNRPLDENDEPRDRNIWYVEKTEEGWSQPRSLGPAVNTDQDEDTPGVDKDGTLYFSRSEAVGGKFEVNIYRSRFLNGRYGGSEKLAETVNSPANDVYPYIAPDGSYLVYNTSRFGIGFQLCVSFLRKDGSWTEAKPLEELLGPFLSWCQGISPDGQHLFFAGHKNGVWDICWVDARIIEELKPKELK